jgi:integrase
MDRGQFDPWRGGYLVERLSLKEAEGRFLEAKELEGLRPNSLSAYTYALKGLRKSLSPGQMLSYLSSEDIRPYVYDPEVANSTRRHRYRHLNAWLNWCEDEGYLPDGNPMEDVSKPRKEERKSVFLSPSDLEHLLGTIDAHAEAMQSKPGRNPHDNWLKDVIQVAVATGLRRNELLSLRWGDVDLQNEFLWVRNREDGTFKTKSGSERTVPLAGDALNVLRKRSEQFPHTATDPVFVDDDGGSIRPDRVSGRFKFYVREAEFPNAERLCFHSLRHTCASWLAMKGVPMRVIQAVLGHSSINMTEIYSHLRPEVMSRAMRETFGSGVK